MARFSEEWLRELLSKNDIVDVVSEYVQLTKRGGRFWGTCPWHPEKKPSFSVTPEREMFYCFSCKKGGGVVNFIMEMEKLTFAEAVEFLADRVGMTVPQDQGKNDYREKQEYRKKLHGMMRKAAIYYNRALNSKQGEKAMEYIRNRKVDSQAVRFGLGYAPDSFDAIKKYLEKEGYTQKEMLDAGLLRQKNGHTYDTFRNRVIFPIQNVMGDVVAFGGRVLDDGDPKYLHSMENTIFSKRYIVYAMNLVKKNAGLKNVLLVEGYMDVVALAAAGINNAVASLGTALTREQARQIKRFVNKVYLCYDGDRAGQDAAFRGVDILRAEGLTVNVITLPDGMDPDEYVKANGAYALRKLAQKAPAGIEFKLRRMEGDADLSDPDTAVEYASRAAEVIRDIDNELEKERYVKYLSNRTGISMESIWKSVGREDAGERYILPKNERKSNKKADKEHELMELLLESPELAENATYISEEDILDDTNKKIFLYIKEQIKAGIVPARDELLTMFAGVFDFDYEKMSQTVEISLAEKEDKLRSMAAVIKKKRLEERRERLVRECAKATGEERIRLLRELDDLKKQFAGADSKFRG